MKWAGCFFLNTVLLLVAALAFAQDVATEISHPHVAPLPRGQIVIDITTLTKHQDVHTTITFTLEQRWIYLLVV